jgi:predicted dienelactone hydrolase
LSTAILARAVVAVLLLLAASPVGAAGFQFGSAPDPDDRPIELGIWYPSDAPAAPKTIGPVQQDVAYYGPVAGKALPLIVISHGTGGSALGHYDTALALADAGFVVVALSHTGDNYKDRAYSFTPRNFTDRPRHVSRVVDFMLNDWDGHDRLDPARIGIFGHSAGAATALILIGGNPDLSLAVLFCRDHREDWGCRQARELSGDRPLRAADWTTPDWHHDPRLKAAALAAPALGQAFGKTGLANVTAPVQLWRAEDDVITPNKWFGDIVRDDLPTPPEDHLVAKAGHFDFLAPCGDALAKLAPDICNSEPGFDRSRFHQEMNKAIVAFFTAKLAPP